MHLLPYMTSIYSFKALIPKTSVKSVNFSKVVFKSHSPNTSAAMNSYVNTEIYFLTQTKCTYYV